MMLDDFNLFEWEVRKEKKPQKLTVYLKRKQKIELLWVNIIKKVHFRKRKSAKKLPD